MITPADATSVSDPYDPGTDLRAGSIHGFVYIHFQGPVSPVSGRLGLTETIQFIHQHSKDGLIKPFQNCLGHWRPDVLLTNGESARSGPCNGHETLEEMARNTRSLGPVSVPHCMVDGLFTLFPRLPVLLFHGEDELSSLVVFG